MRMFLHISTLLRHRWWPVAIMLLLSWECTAQGVSQTPRTAPPQEILKVVGISVEGNTLADPAAIIANSGLRVGDQITIPGDQVAQAVRKLWSLRIFDDVQVLIDKKIEDGVYLLIKVKELPRYERAEIKGADEVSEDDVRKKLNLIRGQVFPPQEVYRIRKDILALYEKEGYLLATVDVTPEAIDTLQNRVAVKINIDEGKEVQVNTISFEGDSAFSDGDLRGAMSETSEKHWWKFWSSAKFDRKKYDEDKKLIVQYYQKHGFRDAQILSDTISYSNDKKDMFIHMKMFEGPQYKLRHITWTGNAVYKESDLNDRLNMQSGDVYDLEKFEKNLRGNDEQTDVASLYLDNGYLKFNLDPQETRVPPDSVDVAINVFEMNQFRVGEVRIRGNTKTQDKVIRRELYTRPGDYFSRASVIRSLRQLQQLNYFNPEKLKPDYNLLPDDKTVDLTYEVEEKSSDNVNASVGYSGAYGFTGALGFTINNFAISEPFSGGAGQVLSFEWQFGEAARYRTFSLGFTEPWMFNTPTLFGFQLYDTRQVYNGDIQTQGASVRIGRRFKWPDDYFRADWILAAQRYNIRDGIGYYTEGIYTQVGLTQIIQRNSTDNPIFPSIGSIVSLTTEISGGPFLPGDLDFHKWIFSSDWYTPLFGTQRLVLSLNTQYGVLFPIGTGGGRNIPSIELFSMGGTGVGYINTTPLRGYEDQSIGPHPAGSTSIAALGGKAMTKSTLEVRFSVSLNPIPIYLLGFVEGGNVFESIKRSNFFDLKRSAGFGARLLINPIGMIGFDYGYGFDDVYPLDGKPDGWHFHFVFGKGF
jgi:outer membrane protein insertion porin family